MTKRLSSRRNTKKKQQVIVIHGGDSFLKKSEYLHFLKTVPLTLKRLLPSRGWKSSLPQALGPSYEVLLPRMPNDMNARYGEWKLWFGRMRPYLKSNVVLVGHSQGGLFLIKYLSENSFPRKIRALILVAPPHNQTKGVGDFRLTSSFRRLRRQSSRIIFFHSQDDPVVPFREMKKYQVELPDAEYIVFKKRGHFTQARFPEMVRLIKKL